jgi:hypothetical protein
MSDIVGHTGHQGTAIAVVNESYSFACMRCGHGWEQSYEIEHHIDADGHEFVTYVADGEVVPSPLSRPTCMNCGSHVVRIMRPGRVSSAQNMLRGHPHQQHEPDPVDPAESGATAVPGSDGHRRHWLSDLLNALRDRV